MEDLVQQVADVDEDFHDFIVKHAKPMFEDTTDQLEKTLDRLEKIIGDSRDSITDKQAKDIDDLVTEMSPIMIQIHATNPTHSGELLETLLVAAATVGSGESGPIFLTATIDEIRPELRMLQAIQGEVDVAVDLFESIRPILQLDVEPKEKQAKLTRLFGKHAQALKKIPIRKHNPNPDSDPNPRHSKDPI